MCDKNQEFSGSVLLQKTYKGEPLLQDRLRESKLWNYE